ncbi:TauD/TfdA dioxygenase family protein [Marilutibacter chinensis]|uniref:TauD/TfdA family dioxygenase n=1 Tax=Marilutibacter chinensis TaxID=2912247 RepID=A0ABS9HY40_9GAMM|nr:TauD/TfdA family dioxygenase [Lysobacter chinensis]MCF7223779.1 TauD/TfdA family dioxygenase [Lysobacter chinensis]
MMRPTRQAGISVRPLAHALGAEVNGIDLARQPDSAAVAFIRDAWKRHLVLVFPGQDVSAEAHTRFCSAFGALREIRPVAHQVPDEPYVRYVSNVRDSAINPVHESGEMQFHADQSYLRVPCIATTLYAMEVPNAGGNTMFINCYDAYATLPHDLKRAVVGRKALNVLDYASIPTLRGSALGSSMPQWWHPMVRTHPETGREALFVNRMMTRAVEGLDHAESGALLRRLFEHQEQERFMYEHVWAPGDFLMWDNRCTLHARRDFDPRDRRMLRRVTIHARTAD